MTLCKKCGKHETTGKICRYCRKPTSGTPISPENLPFFKKRRKHATMEEAAEAHRERSSAYGRAASLKSRDIGRIPSDLIDWDRRLRVKESLKYACETYFPRVFYLGWSDDQLRAIAKIEKVFDDQGTKFALAMPRGGGKTALCRAGLIWGTALGKKVFPYFVGASQPKAGQTLRAIKTNWERNILLQQDFPEIGYPIKRAEGRNVLTRGQLHYEEPTYITWGADNIRYPCLLFTDEEARPYVDNDPESVVWLDEYQRFMPVSAGVAINTAGIDGSIRGEAESHPLTLAQPRPDVVLLDDVQKDQKAESDIGVGKLVVLIDGAISGLAGPGKNISALMPCTVIREGDASDQYLTPELHPDWNPERCRMVLSWPPGINDVDITMDTPAGEAWNRYSELRVLSQRTHGDLRDATKFYAENREVMDENFRVSWPDRFDPDKELSAQQHAMNLRMTGPQTFIAEYQNVGRRLDSGSPMSITAKDLAKKTNNLNRFVAPAGTNKVVAFIDVQNEMLFWGIMATSIRFNAHIVAYGSFPEVQMRDFYRRQTESWSYLTKRYFERHPEQRDRAIKTATGQVRAPLDEKIHMAVSDCIDFILSQKIRVENQEYPIEVDLILIDTRWGKVSDTIKKLVKNHDERRRLMCYFGQGLPPSQLQFEELIRQSDWTFEDDINPRAQEIRFILKRFDSGQEYILADVNRLKDFLFSRLSTPSGLDGGILLHQGSPDSHAMFARQVCNSEYPDPQTARGRTKNMWITRSNHDNEYLDIAVGLCCGALFKGCYVPLPSEKPRTKKAPKKLQEIWKEKRGQTRNG